MPSRSRAEIEARVQELLARQDREKEEREREKEEREAAQRKDVLNQQRAAERRVQREAELRAQQEQELAAKREAKRTKKAQKSTQEAADVEYRRLKTVLQSIQEPPSTTGLREELSAAQCRVRMRSSERSPIGVYSTPSRWSVFVKSVPETDMVSLATYRARKASESIARHRMF